MNYHYSGSCLLSGTKRTPFKTVGVGVRPDRRGAAAGLDLLSSSRWTPVQFQPVRVTLAKARAAPRSGASRNVEVGGCGGYGWRQRRPPEGAGDDDGGKPQRRLSVRPARLLEAARTARPTGLFLAHLTPLYRNLPTTPHRGVSYADAGLVRASTAGIGVTGK